MKKLSLMCAVALASFAGLASAQIGGSAGGETFSSLDTDQDGVITRSEAAYDSELRSQWSDLDANQDDQLDEGEFARFESMPDTETDTEENMQKYR